MTSLIYSVIAGNRSFHSQTYIPGSMKSRFPTYTHIDEYDGTKSYVQDYRRFQTPVAHGGAVLQAKGIPSRLFRIPKPNVSLPGEEKIPARGNVPRVVASIGSETKGDPNPYVSFLSPEELAEMNKRRLEIESAPRGLPDQLQQITKGVWNMGLDGKQ